MILSRITSKSQVTLPKPVRAALGLKDGDSVTWTIDDKGRVSIQKFALVNLADPFVNNFSTFTEWADELDEAAFRDL